MWSTTIDNSLAAYANGELISRTRLTAFEISIRVCLFVCLSAAG